MFQLFLLIIENMLGLNMDHIVNMFKADREHVRSMLVVIGRETILSKLTCTMCEVVIAATKSGLVDCIIN